MEDNRETFRFMLPRTVDWEEPLEERRREVDRVDGRPDCIVGVSVVESLGIRERPERWGRYVVEAEVEAEGNDEESLRSS